MVLVIRTSSVDDHLNDFIDRVYSIRNNTVLYVLSEDHTFGEYSDLWEYDHNVTARIIHCNPVICDSAVYSLLEYEVQDFVGILLWDMIRTTDSGEDGVFVSQVLSDLSLHMDPSDPLVISRKVGSDSYFFVIPSKVFRSLVTHACFSTEYERFNPINKLRYFSIDNNYSNCTVRKDNEYNSKSAVILTVYTRNYLKQILPLICNQTATPSLIFIVQNQAYQSIKASSIPSICREKHVKIYHFWLSNWNSYSYMRHYVPIPSSIHTTILVDDDMFLSHSALEKGIQTMRERQCIATERGKLINMDPDGHASWPMVIGKELKELQYVDYAFIPLFLDTEWRKSIYKIPPFSRVYGDILFMSLSIYQDRSIMPCVVPQFDFFLRNEDGDAHATSRKNRGLYNFHYTRIATMWIEKGYIPLEKRALTVILRVCSNKVQKNT